MARSNMKSRAGTLPDKHISPHGTVMAVSMMKDEGPFVLEWIAHHMAVGFTDLLVYTNDCSDGTDDMLIRLEELGLAYHRRNDIPEGIKPQPSALKYAQVEPLTAKADWLLVFDADEFLCIKHGDGSLDGLIDGIKAEGGNGMVITWRIFGSGGVHDWSRDPVTEQYLYAAPPMWNKGWGVKTLFQFDPDVWKLGIHRPKMKNKVLDTEFPDRVKWLNGSGRPMEDYFKFRGWRSIVRTVGYDWAQMNHYAVKGIDSYAMRKFRGNVNNKKDKYNDAYWSLQDRNEVRDDTMLRYSERRREIFEGLLSDPELNRLHHAALEMAEAKLNTFKGTPEYEEFVANLKTASAAPITQVEAKPPKARDKEKIAALMSDVEKRATSKPKEQKKKPVEQQEVLPVDVYVRGEVDMSATPPMEWFANHSVQLPADPRLFTPPALIQISEGKFERPLARNVPKWVQAGGTYLDYGAASGFVGTHIAQERADVTVVLQERCAELRTFIRGLWAQNGVAESARVQLAEDVSLGDLLKQHQPDVLALGDPEMTADALQDAFAVSKSPQIVLLMGRLWADRVGELKAFEAVFAAEKYVERLQISPLVAAGYRKASTAV
ncbi:glycosyltransferase family 2 protein [Cognatishimia sp. MH4019]|uniref:glycosyltransferase family 2 protein n=1 Tax=Cognatishimia sp. MH4019 TaxID=2854030 RepID=UPI001CD3C46D